MPAVLYLIAITQAPFLATLYYSGYSWKLLYPQRGIRLVGLMNYGELLSDSLFYSALFTTVLLTIPAVLITSVLGLFTALLLNRRFQGRRIAIALLVAPFFIMETVNPLIWKNMIFSSAYGLLTWVLSLVGGTGVDMIGQKPLLSILIMIVWQWTPFMTLILLAGLQSFPPNVIDAAKIDGAGYWAQFRFLLLPYLQSYLSVAALLEVILIIPSFGHI
ncbi:MAG: sugar ABC transporter permease [Desulfobacterales bacterium]|nr:MAG: sugar ABC transporter permease [Desulfobacterales bacterium]